MRVSVRYARALALEPRLEEALALVTPARREKALRHRKRPDLLRSVAAGLLLRKCLGVSGDSDLIAGPLGRPELSLPGPFFNLSHSGDFTALALCRDGPCGLDIEPVDRASRRDLLAARVFSPEERELLASHLADRSLFYILWTRKESLLKAAGLGLFREPASFSTVPLHAPSFRALGAEWALASLVREGHVFSIAAPAERDTPLECEILESTAEELLS
ncbi:MAG: 4'-phosphopantetheinyl transferase superfamily protein [Deltaproteobacteria bacterium]|nr:4'-phosphopantetheinyl transferase superfamily protein [Deltaproteobacteria bacterium]